MIKRILVSLIGIIILATAGLYVSGNGFIITAIERTYLVGNTTANIDDHQQFDVQKIGTNQPQELEKHLNYNKSPLPIAFEQDLNKYQAAAFVVIKDGQVLSENYYNDYHSRSKTNSFSMAKTVTTLLVGIAIDEGHIKSFDQAITDFLPEFSDDPLGKKATLAHLSLMNSGYEWDENYYTPFSPTVELYHGSDVEDFLLDRPFSAEPGSFWEYSSASTQLLGIALLRALKKAGAADNLSEYLSEKIWQPLQMNDDALWHTDASGMELTYCCINTNARNFAKLGLLMLNKGNWNGQQIVSADFIEKMIQADGQPFYGYSTWLYHNQSPAYFSFNGHLGQYIIIVPEHDMVVVRLGRTRPAEQPDRRLIEINRYVATALDLVKQSQASTPVSLPATTLAN